MANLITLSRLFLLVVVVVIACQPPSQFQLVNVPLLILVFVTDGLDGYVARRFNETSRFGAMFDIAGDRIVELTLWLLLLQPLPVIAPELWADQGDVAGAIGWCLVLAAVLLCLARGLPVIVEFIYTERRAILGSLVRPERPAR